MSDWLKVIFQPKSIGGLLIASGIFFLFTGGISKPFIAEMSNFFTTWGIALFLIGIAAWLVFFIPAAARNISA